MNTWTTRAVTAATASAAALALAGCGSDDATASGSGDGLTVVAGFYPLEWAAQRVGGDRLDVSSLTPPGAEAHDLELAPQDVATVAEAEPRSSAALPLLRHRPAASTVTLGRAS